MIPIRTCCHSLLLPSRYASSQWIPYDRICAYVHAKDLYNPSQMTHRCCFKDLIIKMPSSLSMYNLSEGHFEPPSKTLPVHNQHSGILCLFHLYSHSITCFSTMVSKLNFGYKMSLELVTFIKASISASGKMPASFSLLASSTSNSVR